MFKKIILLLSLSFFITKTFSQKCASPFWKAEYYFDKEKMPISLCVFREPIVKNDGKIFKTKYTFKADGGKENYTIEFIFDKNKNRIFIEYQNTNSNLIENEEISFDPNGSLYIFKNYKQNIRYIQDDQEVATLFTIYEPDEPYITLNQFQSFENDLLVFKLGDIENNLSTMHNLKVQTLKPPPKTIIPDADKIDIISLKGEIEKYKDSVIKQIDNSDKAFIYEIWPREANYPLAQKFTSKLNTVFYNYYKNEFPYQDHESRIEFNFSCNADGNIDINFAKNIRSINSLQIKWIEESFRGHILPELKKEVFETMTVLRKNENLIDEFNKRFQARISNLNLKDPGVEDVINIKKIILDEFAKKMERSINIKTEFTYILKYESIVKDDIWEYKVIKSREFFRSLNSDEILTDELKSKFEDLKIDTPKKHKYNIKRCFVQINDEKSVQDIKQSDL